MVASRNDVADAKRHARSRLDRLAAGVARVEQGAGTGRNFTASRRAAEANYRGALVNIVVIEDACGVEAAAALSDRLYGLRHRADRAGLMSVDTAETILASVLHNMRGAG